MKSGDNPEQLVTWNTDAGVGLVGFDETVFTEFTDLNSDGHTDAILTAEDGRIWTRLGDGEGGFGEAVDQSDGITNALVKTSGGDGWNKGAYSEESFVGAGSVSANALQTDKHVMFGLSSDAADSGYASINYAILMHADGKLYVYEDGNSLGEFGPYEIGDTPSVERLDDGTVQYLNNGEVFYSSTVTSDSDVPLKADLSINNNGTRIGDVRMKSGDNPEQLVTWNTDAGVGLVGFDETVFTEFTDLNSDGHTDAILTAEDGRIWTRLGDGEGGFENATAQGVGFEDNSLIKVGGGADWNGGAYSEEGLTGSGKLTTVVTDVSGSKMVGLSGNWADPHYSTIQFALYMTADSRLYIFENTVDGGNNPTSRGDFGPIAIGDELSIERHEDGTIQYLKNGSVIYTSSVSYSASKLLRVDASMRDEGTKIGPVTLTNSSDSEVPVSWITNGNVAVDFLRDGVETSFVDVNGDDIADAVLTTSDGELWTRLADGQGNFGEATAQGTGSTDNGLIKVAGNSDWAGGAHSTESFSGAGSVTTTVVQNRANAMIGLSSDGRDTSYSSIQYAIYQTNNGNLQVYEAGSKIGEFGPYSIGDKLTVERLDDGTIQYLKNDVVFHTNTAASASNTALRADVSMHFTGGRLGPVTLTDGDGNQSPVNWVTNSNVAVELYRKGVETDFHDINGDGHADAVLSDTDGRIWTRLGDGQGGFGDAVAQGDGVQDNSLVKVSGGNSFNRGAYSEESFIGAGSVSVIAQQIDKDFMLGLSSTGTGSDHTSIEFAIDVASNGLVYVFESGTNRGDFGTYSVGDEFAVERLDDGTVQYLKNGDVFHTSTVTSDKDIALKADLSVNFEGTRVGDVKMVAEGQPAKSVTWHMDAGLERVGTDGAVEVAYQDLNSDGKLDAILSAEDGRIWTRMGDGDGGFGAAQEQGDGLQSNALVKTTGGNAWNRGAYSEESFAGEGSISLVAQQTHRSFMFGLSSDGRDSGYTSIKYGVQLHPDGRLFIYESNSKHGELGAYVVGDKFTVKRLADGTVQYLKNGEVFYTSTVVSNPDVALKADLSVDHEGTIVGDVTMRSGDGPEKTGDVAI